MSEELLSSEDNDISMSADDLAILQAFDSMDVWQQPESSGSFFPKEHNTEYSQQDMLFLFAAEMDEDIGQMKHALSQLEQGDTLDETRFAVLRRAAHKVRGTAGAMDCHAMASIARHIEEVVTQITTGVLHSLIGLNALVHAVLALEVTVQDLLTHGKESDVPLQALEQELEQFSLAQEAPQSTRNPVTTPLAPSSEVLDNSDKEAQVCPPLTPSISVEVQRFERLLRLSEQLSDTRTPLDNAQEQVDIALRELHTAQAQIQRLERVLTELARPISARHAQQPSIPASSLVERMLKEARPQKGLINDDLYKGVTKYGPVKRHLLRAYEKTEWDELELDSYSERDKTVAALRDAIAQVTIANTHMQRSYAHLHSVMQQYVEHATDMQVGIQLLRLTPLSVLVPHLQQILTIYAPNVLFEVTGETTEVDKDILDALIAPLTTLLQTCVVAIQSGHSDVQRVWLAAQAIGNEVTVEIGFSMTVQGGALDTVRSSVERLRGTIELHRNAENGVSFFLRVPRSQGTVRGLLVRVGDQNVVLPFSQIQSVSDEQHQKIGSDEQHQKTTIIYHLHKLLNFPYEPNPLRRVTPLIMLPQGRSRLIAGILVDEVVSDVSVVVKPLPAYLQRPGIAGTAFDGKGNVLLLLDIPALLKHYTLSRRNDLSEEGDTGKVRKTQRLALIADDSALLRKTLVQTLEQARFATAEARDGLEALDLLTQNPPDVFVLDMEMPNMNGYDLLNLMHVYPELNDVKTIVLTSRTLEKYKQHAFNLGAHAYLIKPCPPDVLLKQIEELLQ